MINMRVLLSTSGDMQSLSKKKKKKSGRSLMLSEVMPFLSGDLGEQIQSAVENQDGDKIAALMSKVGQKLKEKFEKH